MDTWYVGKAGVSEGPFDRDTVQARLFAGDLALTDLVWNVGMPAWIDAGSAGFVAAPPMHQPLAVLPAPLPVPRSGLHWPAPNADVSGGHASAPPPPSVDDDGWQDTTPAPWSRYLARTLDTTVFGLLIWFTIGIVSEAISPPFYHALTGPHGVLKLPAVDAMLTALIVVPVLAAQVGLGGTSLGKWIFGVRITARNGRPIGFLAAIKREMLVYVAGRGFGIPLFAIIAAILGYRSLTSDKVTMWDEGKPWVVTHRPPGTLGVILFIAGLVACVALAIYIRYSL